MKSVFSAILVLLSISLFADQQEILVARLWWELEPAVYVGDEYPLSEEEAIKRLLEYARLVFSAMIYGYSFTYEPSDKIRAISENFELNPVAQIPWGDKNLEVVSSDVREKKLYVQLAYKLEDFQKNRRQAWGSNTVAVSAGAGTGDVFIGPQERLMAIEDGIRDAVRSYLKSRLWNKPRKAEGEVILWETPVTYIKSGYYLTQVKVKLRVQETLPYKVF